MSRHHRDDRPVDADARLDDEIAFHIEQQTAKFVQQGMPPEVARREALKRFGGVEGAKDAARDERRFAATRGLGRDFRYGARALRRAPEFFALAVLTLGLGIASSTALFSVVQGVLLRDLPYPESDRIVRLYQINVDGTAGAQPRRSSNANELNVIDWRQRTHSFDAIAMMATGTVPMTGPREPVLARWSQVSREFADVMGVRPHVGRWFVADEAREGGPPVAVISPAFRKRLFGDSLPHGAVLKVREQMYAVIGEMPEGFDYPAATDVWTPREATPLPTSRTAHNVQVVARLSRTAALDAAIADIGAVSRRMRDEHGDQTWMVDATAIPLLEQITSAIRPALQLLFWAACLLFVIAGANVSNLLLARQASRRQMIAIQLAIGAGRWRVLRQHLVEILLICLAAAIVGVVGAQGAVRGLLALDPGTIPRIREVHLDWSAVAFAIGTALAAALAIGLATTLRRRDRDLRHELDQASRGGSSEDGARAREVLVLAQVAMTVVLLAGTALLARSFVEVLRIDPGYRTEGVVALDMAISRDAEPDARQRQWQLQQEFMTRLRALPGVDGVGLISGLPAGGAAFYPNGRYLEMTRVDELASSEDVVRLGSAVLERAGQAGYRVASEDYFRVMGIPVLQGRTFQAGDTADAPHVAVISRSFAEARWPGRDPIGRFVQFGNMDGDRRGFRVVGVVGDVRELSPESAPGPLFYVDYRQRPGQAARVNIVVSGGGADLGVTAQRILRELEPNVPLLPRAVADTFDAALNGRRFNVVLIAVFGTTALGLAVLGTYGLISYLVTQRRREIGIRLALGADSVKVLRLVIWSAMRLALAGAVVGLVAALFLRQLVDGLLFAISPSDPATLTGAVVVTAGAVIAASLLPAWRATNISPVETLR